MNYQKIIQNIENQLKNYIGNRKAIIGISGGLDSSVVAALCARALGKENVLGISMPYGDQETYDADLVIRNLGINGKTFNIKEEVDIKIRKLEKMLGKEIDKVTKGNIMARERMNTLYGFSNELDGMVIGTGNKSEIEIGYFTKYGDGGVDLEPIGDLYKTEIFELATYLPIAVKIINKNPSAELWDNQTDEDELGMKYKQLDSVLKGEITVGPIYDKVQKMRENSEHKKNMPPVFKVRED